MRRDQKRLRARYVAAVQALSPLVRAVFLLHRIDDLTYNQIAGRLSIEHDLVMDCLSRALFSMVCSVEDGRAPSGPEPPLIAEAEAVLLKEHLRYRARRALLLSLPKPGAQSRQSWNHRLAAIARRLTQHPLALSGRHPIPPARDFDAWLLYRTGPETDGPQAGGSAASR